MDGFNIDAFRKQLLVEGLDDIAFTLRHRDDIAAFERSYERGVPWI